MFRFPLAESYLWLGFQPTRRTGDYHECQMTAIRPFVMRISVHVHSSGTGTRAPWLSPDRMGTYEILYCMLHYDDHGVPSANAHWNVKT